MPPRSADAAAIKRGDPMAASILGGALHPARDQGYLNTVIAISPQVTGYLIEHAAQMRQDPFIEQLIDAALEVTRPSPAPPRAARCSPSL
jgi:hypothetical protein